MVRWGCDDGHLYHGIRCRRRPAEEWTLIILSDVLDDPEVGEGGIAEAAGDIEGCEDVAEGNGVVGGICKGDGELGDWLLVIVWDSDVRRDDGEGDEYCWRRWSVRWNGWTGV